MDTPTPIPPATPPPTIPDPKPIGDPKPEPTPSPAPEPPVKSPLEDPIPSNDSHEGATEEKVGDLTGPRAGCDNETVQVKDKGGVASS